MSNARFPRASGVLAHPTSLPGAYGIGDLGPSAYRFLEFLAAARQSLWQVLPLTPTGFGNSPYSAPSALAGNPLLVAFEPLLERRWLEPADLAPLAALRADHVDFDHLIPLKHAALRQAYQRFRDRADEADRQRFATFRAAESGWLNDFTLFTTLQEIHQAAWNDWPTDVRDRQSDALRAAVEQHQDALGYHAFAQWQFFEQWDALHAAARERGIRIVGDLPIFVAYNSADVWAHRDQFKLDAAGAPSVVAGVPPDYFSETGQRWGNPLYDWDVQRANGYAWWVERFRQVLRLVDVVRIDHFRGFEAAWEVPAGEPTAVNGAWVPGPGAEVFRAVSQMLGGTLPVVAEDLGLITDEVRALLREVDYPGMKVLQFAFSGEPDNPYLPHQYDNPNCVVYTGTHDNDTTRGWYESAPEAERTFLRRYLGRTDLPEPTWTLIRVALGTVADTAIVPLQDLLDLGSASRMNTPGQSGGNWRWRVTADQLDPAIAARLADLTWLYLRAPDQHDESAPAP